MTLSLNEVETLVRKAALGAGLDPGRAGELAGAAVWLTAADVPVFEIFHRALIAKEAAPLTLIADNSAATCSRTAAAWVGLSAIDLLLAMPPGFLVALETVDEPLIIAALAALAARRDGQTLTVEGKVGVLELGPHSRPDLRAHSGGGPHHLMLRRIHVPAESIHKDDPPPSRYDPGRVGDTGFADLDRLARLTYVPATEHSRLSGAGAGLTDND